MTFVPTVQLSGFRIPRGFYKLSRKLQTLTGPQLDCFVAERTKLKEQIKQVSGISSIGVIQIQQRTLKGWRDNSSMASGPGEEEICGRVCSQKISETQYQATPSRYRMDRSNVR